MKQLRRMTDEEWFEYDGSVRQSCDDDAYYDMVEDDDNINL